MGLFIIPEPIKFYVGQIDEQNGEREYSCTIKFRTDKDPEEFLNEMARTWYGDPREEEEGEDDPADPRGWWHAGEVICTAGTWAEVTKEVFDTIPVINELSLPLGDVVWPE